jgi:hypothetical protein
MLGLFGKAPRKARQLIHPVGSSSPFDPVLTFTFHRWKGDRAGLDPVGNMDRAKETSPGRHDLARLRFISEVAMD